jgi:uncharacterized protein (DUF2267 family)
MTMNTTLTRPERPAVIAGTRPPRDSSAGDVVLAYLRIQAHALKTLEPKVRADELDSVHQMRVATRRLRATLRTYRQVIPPADSHHLAAELQWLGQALGPARVGEVLAAHLRDSLRPVPPELLIGPVQARVQGHFAPQRAAARTALTEALDSPRYHRLLAELDRIAAGPPPGVPSARPSAGCAGPGTPRPARPGTSPCTRRASRPAAPATPPRRRARRSGSRPAGSPGR